MILLTETDAASKLLQIDSIFVFLVSFFGSLRLVSILPGTVSGPVIAILIWSAPLLMVTMALATVVTPVSLLTVLSVVSSVHKF